MHITAVSLEKQPKKHIESNLCLSDASFEKHEYAKPVKRKSRRSVEHCTPHADGAWLNELGWSQ